MVTKDAAFVTIRNTSKRLPNKALLEIKNGLRSVDIVLERAKKTECFVILTTSTNKSDDIFEKIAKLHGIQVFRGSLINKIKRWYDCFTKYQIENALIIDGDDLAYDYEIGLRAILELKSTKSDIISCPQNIVPGFFTYAISKNGIAKLFSVASSETIDTDIIVKFIEKAKLKISYVSLKEHEQNKNLRLTLDYIEDLQFFKKLYSDLDILANGKSIVNHLAKNKTIAEINFYRHKDYLENQEQFNKKMI